MTESGESYAHIGSDAMQRYMENRRSEVEAGFLISHLRPGMNLLDCGCGPGTISVGLAQAIAPGQLVGIDMQAEQTEKAQAFADSQGVSNAQFESASIYELPFPDESFDAVFASAVLEHLSEPIKALEEMNRVLKPGGILAARDADIGYLLTRGPGEAEIARSYEVVGRHWRHSSGDPRIGGHLRRLFNEIGLTNVEATATAESFGTHERVGWWSEIMGGRFREPKIIGEIVDLGFATEEDMHSFSEAWRNWGNHSDSFAVVTWCEVVGWKA